MEEPFAGAAGWAGLALLALGLAGALRLHGAVQQGRAGAAAYLGGLLLWGLLLFGAWWAWSGSARSCGGCEPALLTVSEVPLGDGLGPSALELEPGDPPGWP
ncbi:hypothetical protein [Tepidiforma sp.]|uniref:hypothetical protein n=1 Tax=Tepidiforma sp. TaxID=2682230 RepID=UPI002ADD6AC0|nr:hypothetical protein [Tepidiforma sp.]